MSKISDEALLTQLGFSPNEGILTDLKRVISSTSGYEDIKKHIVTLNETIKSYGSHIGLSSSSNYFKIKNADYSKEHIEKWANKYKVSLIKVANSNTYYIAGKES
jgi:hypothetical protein